MRNRAVTKITQWHRQLSWVTGVTPPEKVGNVVVT